MAEQKRTQRKLIATEDVLRYFAGNSALSLTSDEELSTSNDESSDIESNGEAIIGIETEMEENIVSNESDVRYAAVL